ncbi:MAG: thioredoxin family protein [Sedimentisphaerales bacterium]|nr:thioredoxin family protein [Sedimentisphaerales bacterium]
MSADEKSSEKSNANEPQSCSSQPGSNCCCTGAGGLGKFFWIILIVIIAMYYIKSTQPVTVPDDWSGDLAAAQQIAGSENKNILVAFHTSWCGYCTKMKNEVYSTAAFQKFASDNLVLVMLDGDVAKDAVMQYGINGYPSYVVLGPDGKVLNNFAGYMPVGQFIDQIKQ